MRSILQKLERIEIGINYMGALLNNGKAEDLINFIGLFKAYDVSMDVEYQGEIAITRFSVFSAHGEIASIAMDYQEDIMFIEFNNLQNSRYINTYSHDLLVLIYVYMDRSHLALDFLRITGLPTGEYTGKKFAEVAYQEQLEDEFWESLESAKISDIFA